MPLCAFRSALLVKVHIIPGPVDLYSIKKWAVVFSCRYDAHSQYWKKKEIPFCPHIPSLHVKKDITMSLKMITGFAKLLGTLGMGQLSSQSSYCLSFRLILLRGQNITGYCRDSYQWAKKEKRLAVLLVENSPKHIVTTKNRPECHLQDVHECYSLLWLLRDPKLTKDISEAAYFIWREPLGSIRPEGVWSKIQMISYYTSNKMKNLEVVEKNHLFLKASLRQVILPHLSVLIEIR